MSKSKIKQTAMFTIVANNGLHCGRTALQSARKHRPNYKFYCVVLDRDMSHADIFLDEFEAVCFEDLNLRFTEEVFFRYTMPQLAAAITPWAIEYFLDQGHEFAICVDAATKFYGAMHEVEQILSSQADIVFTPGSPDTIGNDEIILAPGVTEIGRLLAARDATNTRNFLHLWQDEIRQNSQIDAVQGEFLRGISTEAIAASFAKVKILSQAGYDVDLAKIAGATITKHAPDEYLVNQEVLVSVHFGGLGLPLPKFLPAQNRNSEVENVCELVNEYEQALVSNGLRTFVALNYPFGRFANGDKIPDQFRALYNSSHQLREAMGPHPFHRPMAMLESSGGFSDQAISPTNAMMAIRNAQAQLQATFPLNCLESIHSFYRWFVTDASVVQSFSEYVVLCHRQALDQFVSKHKSGCAIRFAQLNAPSCRNLEKTQLLYWHILARTPDPEGFRAYWELCKTNAGFLRAWKEIGLSNESRERPHLTYRMLKALFMARHGAKLRPHSPTTTAPPADPSPPTELFSGLFQIEADVKELGVWVSNRVIVPMVANYREKIRLEGIYYPDAIKKQSGHAYSIVSFRIRDVEIHSAILEANGEFAIEFEAPVPSGTFNTPLTIESSEFFVPQQKGDNADARMLCWRMKRFTMGDSCLVDCTRKDIFAKSTGERVVSLIH